MNKLLTALTATILTLLAIVGIGAWGFLSVQRDVGSRDSMPVTYSSVSTQSAQVRVSDGSPQLVLQDDVNSDTASDGDADFEVAESDAEEMEAPVVVGTDDAAVLAVQIAQAQQYCFGENPTFYESHPTDEHVQESGNVTKIDNQLLVTFVSEATQQQITDVAAELGGYIVGCIAAQNLYQVQFDEVLPTDGSVTAQWQAHELVVSARPYEVTEVDNGDE